MDDFELEAARQAAAFGKDVADDLVRPTSKCIGENIGLLVDSVMGWLGYWGTKQKIKRDVYLKDYKRKITEEILRIPAANIQEPSIRILGPTIEEFFLNY